MSAYVVQGKPRTRGLPAAAVAATGLDKEESQGVGGAEEAAADMFKPKPGQVWQTDTCSRLRLSSNA